MSKKANKKNTQLSLPNMPTPDRTAGWLHYEANNSGGEWWLKDEDWQALEDAGWVVHWVHSATIDHGVDFPEKGDPKKDPHAYALKNKDPLPHSHEYGPCRFIQAPRTDQRWLGALAKSACKRFGSAAEGVAEFEFLAHQSARDEGCSCCGPPHSFEWEGDDGTKSYGRTRIVETAFEWD
jgi:hypothetical protein